MVKLTARPWMTVLGLLCLFTIILGTIADHGPNTLGRSLLPRASTIRQCTCDTCGPGASNKKRSSPLRGESIHLDKRVLGEFWKLPYNRDAKKYLLANYHRADWMDMSPSDGVSFSTATFEALEDEPIKTGVGTLTGCVVVAVVSQKGIYLSHHWEVPSFSQGDWQAGEQGLFDQRVLNELENGGGTDMPSLTRYMGADGPFAAQHKPRSFVFSRKESEDKNYDFFYNTMVMQLSSAVARITNTKTESIHYKNTQNDDDLQITGGKVFFEYDPDGLAESKCQTALSRLWMEESVPYHDEWEPLDDQKVARDRGDSS